MQIRPVEKGPAHSKGAVSASQTGLPSSWVLPSGSYQERTRELGSFGMPHDPRKKHFCWDYFSVLVEGPL